MLKSLCFLAMIVFLAGCVESEPLDEILPTSTIQQSLYGRVLDHHTQKVIDEGEPRCIILYSNGMNGGLSVSGFHLGNLKSVCELYCN